MTHNCFLLEEGLFAGALALPPEERAEFLQRACGDDPGLAARIEALLRAHEMRDGLLDLDTPDEIAGVARALQAEAPAPAGPRDWIGRYRLCEKIGEGGFGVVWLAEQSEPVKRQVALKIIRPGMDTREVIARFEAERQALALMDHPNIARVFDAGATASGRPYFVMELVPGTPITRYCDDRRLATEARLQLFLQVCRAVQHAHQKGVIHRDLKPSNILVIEQDGVAVPKVIDFGIAKATTARLGDATVTMACAPVIGTPSYMSPEQMELGAIDIDTRSDVYNLGVLLYELLTGQTPFTAETLTAGSFDQLRHIIREQEPPKPSRRLGALDAAMRHDAAWRRAAGFAELRSTLRGDLDWIVMRCLEKDRARRYETANGLARDIARYLQHEPVSARPPTAAYVLRKTMRKHRVAFATGGAIAASLVLGAVASTVEARRAAAAGRAAQVERMSAENARDEAEAHKRNAETEGARSAHVAQFMKDMLKGVGPEVARGRDTALLRTIMDQTAERVRRDLANNPEVFADLAETLGLVYSAIGEDVVAQRLLREAMQAQQELHGRESLPVARLLHELAGVLARRERFLGTLPLLRESLAIRQQLLGPRHPDTARTLAELGWTTGRFERTEGVAQLKESLAIQRETLGSKHPDVARTLTYLGTWSDRNAEELRLGESWLREALEIHRHARTPDSVDVINAEHHLGGILFRQGRLAPAEQIVRDALERCRTALADTHPLRSRLLHRLGNILAGQRRPAEAEACLREGLSLAQRNRDSVAHELVTSLVQLLTRQERHTDAVNTARDAMAITRRVMADDSLGLGQNLAAFAAALIEGGRPAEAEAPLREAIALLERATRFDGFTQNVRRMLGVALTELGRFAEAEEALLASHRGLVEYRRIHPVQALGYLALSLPSLVRLYAVWGRPEDVTAWTGKSAELIQELTDASLTPRVELMKRRLRDHKPLI